eukprot:2383126-Pyramimonas_sp.AAC.1
MFIPIALRLFGLLVVRSLGNCQANRCTRAPSLQCHGQCSLAAGCSKVAAHQDIEDPAIDATERWRRVGNNFADVGANMAFFLHPSDDGLLQDADRQVKFAKATLKVASAVLHLWPSVDLSFIERIQPPPALDSAVADHRWARWSGIWRCSVCLTGCRALVPPPKVDVLGTASFALPTRIALATRPWPSSAPTSRSFFICLRCKSYSSGGKVRGLAERCVPPTRACRPAWVQPCKGKRPHYTR